MRFPLTALLALVACATPTPRPPSAPPSAPPIPRAAYDPPTVDAPPLDPRRMCREGPAPDTGEGYGYEFPPLSLYPVRWGPRVADMPRGDGIPLSRTELYQGLHREEFRMTACYRWAQHPVRREVAVEATLAIDGLGRVTEATASGGGADLDACIEEVLAVARFIPRPARLTRARVQLAFAPSGLPAARSRPPRPSITPPLVPAACVERDGPIPTDEVTWVEGPFVTYDDWTPERAEIARRRAHPDRPPRAGPRRHVVPCGWTHRVPPRAILDAVRANQGALNGCLADARAAGERRRAGVAARFELDARGAPQNLRIEGEEGALASCLREALGEVFVPHIPIGETITVLLPFALEAPASLPADPLERGEALLEVGRGRAAREAFTEVARRSHEGDGCRGRIGVLRAALVDAPWVDDPRVWAAFDDVLEALPRLPDNRPTRACLDAAAPVLASLAMWPFAFHDGVTEPNTIGRFGSPIPGDAVAGRAVARAQATLDREASFPAPLPLRELVVSAALTRGELVPDDMLSALLADLDDPRGIEHVLRLRDDARARDEPREWTPSLGGLASRFHGSCGPLDR